MRNLIRLMTRRVATDERGAVGILVGTLFVTGVVLGMAALTIDAGRLYVERAELQNGADGGALAVAKTCASESSCAPGKAADYANRNSGDGASTVSLVCGQGPGLSGCPAATAGQGSCPAAPAAATSYVDVRTSTKTSGGSSLLPPVFARSLPGNGGYQGTTVYACARAMWGPAVQTSQSLAMTLSYCAWAQATGGTPPTYGTTVRIFVRDAPNAPTCNGSSAPGEFGWLQDEGNCSASIDLTQTGYAAGSDPGKNVTKACQDALTSYLTSGNPIYIPVFDTTTGTGNNASYHLIGLAAFVLTGYANMNPLKDVIPAPFTKSSCPSGSTTPSCIYGHFTQALVPVTTTIGTGPNFGAIAMKLAG
jgi:Flp pilus assembly protein TadG